MQTAVTINYALFLAFFLMVLTIRVLDLRKSPVTRIFHKKDRVVEPAVLERAIRGHGNLTEYAPLFLLILLIGENSGAPSSQLHLAAMIFSIGRLSHGICFSFTKGNLLLRILGMAGTISGFIMLIRILITLQL